MTPDKERHSKSCILKQSKKIRKLSADSKYELSSNLKEEDEKYLSGPDRKPGYNTFLVKEKKQILNSIKKQIVELEALELKNSTDNSFPEIDWAQHLNWLGPEVTNDYILNALKLCRPYLEIENLNLQQLRKKIKTWLKNEGSEDKSYIFRGKTLICEDELPEFVDALEEIVSDMKHRNFKELRTKILPKIKIIHERSGKSFDNRMFTKPYWCKFIKKHQNLRNQWKKLHKIKTVRKKQYKKDKEVKSEVKSECQN